MQGKSDPDRQILDAAAFCRGLVGEGSIYAFLADHRDELFKDEDFSDLFPSARGRPSTPAVLICSVMVLQALEGLSDRDAIRALRSRIDWKVACGLALDDPGFDFTVLTYWRSRLRSSEAPQRIFDAIRCVVEATGLLKGKHPRALDSTILDDAVATQDTVTQLLAAIRKVRRSVPEAALVSLGTANDEGGKPIIEWSDKAARDTLVTGLVADAKAVLRAAETAQGCEEAHDAVGLLALVSGQDVEPGEEAGTWRIAKKVTKDRIISTVDQDLVTDTSPGRLEPMGSRRISRPSPTPGSSQGPRSPQPIIPTARSGSSSWTPKKTASRSWPTPPMDPALCVPPSLATTTASS